MVLPHPLPLLLLLLVSLACSPRTSSNALAAYTPRITSVECGLGRDSYCAQTRNHHSTQPHKRLKRYKPYSNTSIENCIYKQCISVQAGRLFAWSATRPCNGWCTGTTQPSAAIPAQTAPDTVLQTCCDARLPLWLGQAPDALRAQHYKKNCKEVTNL